MFIKILHGITLSSEMKMLLSFEYWEGTSHLRDLYPASGRRWEKSKRTSYFWHFLKLLQFKIFNMPRCCLLGKWTPSRQTWKKIILNSTYLIIKSTFKYNIQSMNVVHWNKREDTNSQLCAKLSTLLARN